MLAREKVLYIDSKDDHLDDTNAFCVHPLKTGWLGLIQKESFDRAVILNVPSTNIKAISLFNIAQAVKENGIVEVYVDQPISVMQSLDASEIEASAKLAGLTDIKQSDFEKWTREGDKDVKTSTIKITMLRPERVVMLNEKSITTTKTTVTGVKKLVK